MNRAYLLTGGNIGNRMDYLSRAQNLIEQFCGEIVHLSGVYETAAWGLEDQESFYNQVICIDTALEPEALMKQILAIEEQMGRIRTIKMGPRIIDIDILLIDDLIINTPLLTVPHPFLPERKFALTPLNEIAPDLVHPVLNKTISELLQECKDPLNVYKI
ncbi:2-amino-4-hydroxy-6-hydroxymethyldihydropteridine diphosphokinase [Danxiaibacter flavus]|uniref:2-amino-4-hydroxy-6-hydroxymethyldihydropteridine pyrophosphokinase n=1 Tax=Danxiaibacter flavus TaxID=3049108 RepID=A0ABV3ZE13_9BACT|nr:2-amino-4-hydroxy-6-hydroxymethyldihydropteridine diphosphokinase [Chitinophagaceae bacterium DXS]